MNKELHGPFFIVIQLFFILTCLHLLHYYISKKCCFFLTAVFNQWSHIDHAAINVVELLLSQVLQTVQDKTGALQQTP